MSAIADLISCGWTGFNGSVQRSVCGLQPDHEPQLGCDVRYTLPPVHVVDE
jgi:hypothetical protein